MARPCSTLTLRLSLKQHHSLWERHLPSGPSTLTGATMVTACKTFLSLSRRQSVPVHPSDETLSCLLRRFPITHIPDRSRCLSTLRPLDSSPTTARIRRRSTTAVTTIAIPPRRAMFRCLQSRTGELGSIAHCIRMPMNPPYLVSLKDPS